MPELPPPPDAPLSHHALGADAVAALRRWIVDGTRDGRASARRVLGAVGAAVALAVVVVVAWRAYGTGGAGRGGAPPELTMPRADAPGTRGADGTAGEAPAVGEGSASETVVIAHVAGAVLRPGLYRLGSVPRVADALDAAGGPAPDADLDALNLAAIVTDGERVYLPRRGEAPRPDAVAGRSGAASTSGSGAPSRIDLNTATAEQLEDLPGVGPATAAAILAYRNEHGRFRSVDELLEVRGIGEARLAELRPRVRVR